MTKEQAIKELKNLSPSEETIETVLSMLKQNSAEIEQKNTELAEKNAEIEKKDKQIDYMIDWIRERSIYALDSHEKLKQYFEKLAERKSEEYKVGKYGLENKTEGMYARTDNGIIGKILNSNSDEMINGPELLVNNKIYCIERNSIKEIRENIIDLIEVGDIIEINGEKYEVIYDESLDKLGVLMPNRNCLEIRHSALEHIFEKYENITILTKEQYMQNCYKIDTN